jgi:hypothetical protein
MKTNRANLQHLLRAFDFKKLFLEELGWDNYRAPLPVLVDGAAYTLQGIAEKRGVAAFVLTSAGGLPDHNLRRKIERQVAKRHREHLIIFSDGRGVQVWQWVRQEPGKPLASREVRLDVEQSGEALLQKLDALAVSLEDEETLTLVDVTGKLKSAFDVERVTKKFYEQFKKEHSSFGAFLKGVPVGDLADWYVSVMLNRLMFIYFIQKKGFLGGDADYLRNRLAASKRTAPDRFYLDFLCPLFFEGFARPKNARDPAMAGLLGDVPYLNGGIFARHQIEQTHGQNITLPDRAFERLFAFFDQYQWHLDDRPLRKDNEINPDVLGYIFEKYINQKQMGAYYTQEDITEYIGKNTIIPYLFDAVQREQAAAFKPGGQVWSLLTADPHRYIYPAVAHGSDLPLPPEIAAGVGDVAHRGEWNKPAADGYALPTEIWRETVARRLRHQEVRAKLAAGEVHTIDELITLNLNIRQFAQDVIEGCDDPGLLRGFWKALRQISVLDPTCGSGAFLFAGLNILEPLYEACLERMAAFVAELPPDASPLRFSDFRKALADVARHPNQRYFIFKSIIVDNLYGVDIMHEAVEIAKLRLFLKLVSLVEQGSQIEPLPDIDFNIRAGNTLVGFATRPEMEAAVRGNRLLLLPEDEEALAAIDEQAADVERLFGRFRQMQTEHDVSGFGEDFAATKRELQRRLGELAGQLDRLLAQQYGVNPDKLEFTRWRESHQPFHWFAEFYGIIRKGGFGVNIGNPPYVEYGQIKNDYAVLQGAFETEKCGNLYAFTIERCYRFLAVNGRLGMIVQLPIVCTDRMKPLQDLILRGSKIVWFSTYDDRPSKLFDGLEHIRASIVLGVRGQISKAAVLSTNYARWHSEMRSVLFQLVKYQDVSTLLQVGAVPKIGEQMPAQIMQKILRHQRLGKFIAERGRYHTYFHNAPQYWIRSLDFVPYFWNERDGQKPSTQVKDVAFATVSQAEVAVAVMNSSIFYWWFVVLSDCRHLNIREIVNFPIDLGAVPPELHGSLKETVKLLMVDYRQNANRKEAWYKTTGKVIYDEFFPKFSKQILDKIDFALSRYYRLTDEELDFIINYDIKYRMGDALGGEGEED